MGPGYFVIAILGCADGGSACTPVATLQTRYENQPNAWRPPPARLKPIPTSTSHPGRALPSEKAEASAEAQRAKPIPARFRRS